LRSRSFTIHKNTFPLSSTSLDLQYPCRPIFLDVFLSSASMQIGLDHHITCILLFQTTANIVDVETPVKLYGAADIQPV
jgi:hypothetical protein